MVSTTASDFAENLMARIQALMLYDHAITFDAEVGPLTYYRRPRLNFCQLQRKVERIWS